MERSLSNRQQQLRAWEIELEGDKKDIAEREKRIEKLADSIIEGRRERAELHRKIANLITSNSELERENQKLIETVEMLSLRVEESEQKIIRLREERNSLKDEISKLTAARIAPTSSEKWVDIDDIITHSCWTGDMKESAEKILRALRHSGKFLSIAKATYDPRSGNMHFIASLKKIGNSAPPTVVIGANWRTRRTWSSVHQLGQDF